MLLLILLPILAAGFFVCKKSPLQFYKLHRYEGQMLYLQSASIGLICAILAYSLLLLIDNVVPAQICGLNINLESFLIQVTQDGLNVNAQMASTITWVFLTTISTLMMSVFWVFLDNKRLKKLSEKHKVDARIIVMGKILADSPLDAILYESYVSEDKLVMLSLSNRKVYVGVVNNMGEPNEIEGFDQEISLVPILSGYRDKDDLSVHWTTSYKDVKSSGDLRIVIRQELIELASEFNFDTWEAFAERRKVKHEKIKVTFNPNQNSFSWTLR